MRRLDFVILFAVSIVDGSFLLLDDQRLLPRDQEMDQMLESSPRIQELIRALEEERQKVEVFHRELPLCLHLINQTIESYKQLAFADENPRQELAAKELISLRPTFSEEEDHMCSMHQEICRDSFVDPDKPAAAAFGSTDGGETGSGGGDGDANTDGSEEGEEKEKCHRMRKVRRYWTEELHKRFVIALEQLGGCHAATPKRIRKVMKVEGLTNDEIKSHLQKFRIHARRTSPTFQSSSNAQADAKFVVVRGIWIPTPDCSTLTATDTPPAWPPIPVTAGAVEAGYSTPVVTMSCAPMFQGSSFYTR